MEANHRRRETMRQKSAEGIVSPEREGRRPEHKEVEGTSDFDGRKRRRNPG